MKVEFIVGFYYIDKKTDRRVTMKNVLQYLEKSAVNYPEKIAAADDVNLCTFLELTQDAKKIGTALTKLFKTNTPVPIFMDKGVNTLKLFFGAVYAGCFYVLLNPELPAVRIGHIAETLEAELIVTESARVQTLKETLPKAKIITFEELISEEADENVLSAIRENMIDTDPLYANFTSGSTGVPKGVLISHRSVIDFIDNFTEIFSITKDDVIGNQAPFDFDVSVKDIYSAMKVGATLQIIPKALFSSPAKLLDHICEREVTTMVWAVSALCLISAFHGLDYKVPEKVNKILFSGETMPRKHLENWMKALKDAQFVNLYGPTEITCNCTYHKVQRDRDYSGGLPIGRAFPNERVFLLSDTDSIITEKGVTGELCISGTALGLGYYNNPEQTKIRFVQNPANKNYIEPIYRTGDLAYWGDDDNLYFAGRKDFQIKYMGHRIELEEIEKALSEVEGVERACCVFLKEKSKLLAFFTGETTGKDIRKSLSATLPVYMIPTSYTKLDSMPITKNGKIDRGALAQLKG